MVFGSMFIKTFFTCFDEYYIHTPKVFSNFLVHPVFINLYNTFYGADTFAERKFTYN